MEEQRITREMVLDALRRALEPLDYVHAMWEGGAAAFDRVDEWSDIDLQVDVDDDRVADTVAAVEDALAKLSGIDLRYELPQPTWHGHFQAFYRLRDASPYLLLDLAVMRHTSADKFLQGEIHGNAVVHFDKSDVTRPAPFDQEEFDARLRARAEALRTTFEMFSVFVPKELHRGNTIEALGFYHGSTLRPLMELLRMRYSPSHYNFHTRYAHYDLPADVVKRLERLFYVADADDLREKHAEAGRFFQETLEALETVSHNS